MTFNATTTTPTTPGIFIRTIAMIDILHDFFLYPSLINLMVSVDVKYHVYLLFLLLVTTAYTTTTITATTKAITIINCCKGIKMI